MVRRIPKNIKENVFGEKLPSKISNSIKIVEIIRIKPIKTRNSEWMIFTLDKMLFPICSVCLLFNRLNESNEEKIKTGKIAIIGYFPTPGWGSVKTDNTVNDSSVTKMKSANLAFIEYLEKKKHNKNIMTSNEI